MAFLKKFDYLHFVCILETRADIFRQYSSNIMIITSESLDPSKLLSFILDEAINAMRSSMIINLLCTYTCMISTAKT